MDRTRSIGRQLKDRKRSFGRLFIDRTRSIGRQLKDRKRSFGRQLIDRTRSIGRQFVEPEHCLARLSFDLRYARGFIPYASDSELCSTAATCAACEPHGSVSEHGLRTALAPFLPLFTALPSILSTVKALQPLCARFVPHASDSEHGSGAATRAACKPHGSSSEHGLRTTPAPFSTAALALPSILSAVKALQLLCARFAPHASDSERGSAAVTRAACKPHGSGSEHGLRTAPTPFLPLLPLSRAFSALKGSPTAMRAARATR